MLDLFVRMLRKATGDEYVIINGMSDIGGETPPVSRLPAHQREILVFPNYEIASRVMEASCVLHVGWPIDYRTYLAQLAQHKSDVSILVAYEQDVDMSDQCAETIAYTIPYGDKVELNTNRLANSLSAVELVLSRVGLSVKAQIYSDWIHDHGPQGRRPVKTWSPVTFTHRASGFLYNVLEYPPLTPVGADAIPSTRQLLSGATPEPANASDEPLRDPVKMFTDVRAPRELQRNGGNIPVMISPQEEGDLSDFSENCLVVQDEFDFIPAICLSAKNPAMKNTICYVKIVGTMQTLAAQ
ncbi:hypothetical protein FRC06_000703, partial [Ceratobasidium sp. 370]